VLGQELRGAHYIEDVRPGIDGKRGIVAPLVGIADLDAESVELSDGGFLGVRAHPGKSGNVRTERGHQLMNHLEHAGFSFRREELLHVELAEGLKEIAVRCTRAELPAGRDLLGPGESAAIEVEVFGNEGFGKKWGSSAGQMPAQIGLPVFE